MGPQDIMFALVCCPTKVPHYFAKNNHHGGSGVYPGGIMFGDIHVKRHGVMSEKAVWTGDDTDMLLCQSLSARKFPV